MASRPALSSSLVSQDHRRTAPSADLESIPPLARRLWLEHQGRHTEVRATPVVIGRSSTCQIVVDDALASRRHAQVRLVEGQAVVEDLGSINGVLVNGERIQGPTPLKVGDRVTVGRDVLVLQETSVSLAAPPGARLTAETLNGVDARRLLGPLDASPDEGTQQASSLDLLAGLADKMLSLGRGDEAERITGSYLNNLLAAGRRRGHLDAEAAERAAQLASRLASATHRGAWVDYVIGIYRLLRKPPPAERIDELYSLIRTAPGWSLPELRALVAELKSTATFGPAERFLVQRLEGLERTAGAL